MVGQQVPLVLRFVYFIFIGLWLGAIAAQVGYVLCLTILGLPLGIFVLHRLPLLMTLAMPEDRLAEIGPGGYYRRLPPGESPPLVLRGLWFILVGWWLAFLWIQLAFLLSASIILSPIGFWMINRVPGILTLEGA